MGPVVRPHLQRRSQSGAGLIVALIMLIVMSMAAIGLVNSVESGLLSAGNFAFRQAALHASDAGSEAAINWLRPLANMSDLYTNNASYGYYATMPAGLDITNSGTGNATILINWDSNQCDDRAGVVCIEPAPALQTDDAGNSIRYIIHRLCKNNGSPQDVSNNCIKYQGVAGSSPQKGQMQYGQSLRINREADVYYRITTRIKGPRNTIVFTQTMVHF